MKILHSADWHLDAPLLGKTPAQTDLLREALRKIPETVARLCREHHCDLLLLSGDLFDGTPNRDSVLTLQRTLEDLHIPVLISPGNHDFCCESSVYRTEQWPENVHIFQRRAMEPIHFPELDCTVWGAGYESIDCPALLKDFRAEDSARYQIGVLHADPTQASSPYCPVTTQQIRSSRLDYLALGHIHKAGSLRADSTLCAWPGCPMGKDYGETGEKGLLLVTLEEEATIEFLPLSFPRFFDENLVVGEDPAESLASILPAAQTEDFYRITLTGYSKAIELSDLYAPFSHIPNLELRDQTLPELDLWSCIDDDTLEGVFFRTLHNGLDTQSQSLQRQIKLAARISRQILDGQEVVLP